MQIDWLTAFLDFPRSSHAAAVEFWSAATGQVVSASRGELDEFSTLLPIGGDDYLRVQRLGDGPARVHLDLHTTEPEECGRLAEELGATLVHSNGYARYTSPGGLTFCVVTQPCSVRTAPARWPEHISLLDQVCIDIPGSKFESESDFWSALLGLEVEPSPGHDEFMALVQPPGHPLRLLLQRRDDDAGPTRAHLDFSTDNRPAEVARLVGLGAEVLRETDDWTTMRDPAGLEFCVTDRSPVDALPART